MENSVEWLKEQMRDKKWRVYFVILTAVIIALGAEFYIFSYGIWKSIRYMLLAAGLTVIARIDCEEKRIPNRILAVLLCIRIVLLVCEWLTFPKLGFALLISAGLGMLIGGGIFLVAYLILRGGVGMGDIKLFIVIGSYVGAGSIMAVIFWTAISSAVYSIVMLICKKIKLKEEIPFAPFILIGTIVTMALGM